MESVAQRAIALIREHGALRSTAIAEKLGVSSAVIASSLAGQCKNGTLISCKVELPSGPSQNEYRLSASGPAKSFRTDPAARKPPTLPPPPDATATAPKPRKAKKPKKDLVKQRRVSASKSRRSASIPRSKATRKKARKSIAVVQRKPTSALVPAGHRWALTSDGAFILMGTATEIPRPAARSLVEFIRVLDRGEIAQGGA